MRLEAVRIVLRPRTPWEAIDLGLSLVREHARAIWGPWFLASVPVLVVLNLLALWAGHPWLAFVAMWWLKPAFARIPLFVLSHAVFGATPTRREVLRAFIRQPWRPLWPALAWRRLDPCRSFHVPIDQLEGLAGGRGSERRRVWRRAVSMQALTLTFVLFLFVVTAFLSAWSLGLMFVPSEFFDDTVKAMWATFFEQTPLWLLVLVNAVWWLAESAVEPFYIGGGFGMYLNRRIHIEAWDLELHFRRLAARLRELAQVAMLVACILVPIAAGITPLRAEAAPAMAATTAGSEAAGDEADGEDENEDVAPNPNPAPVTWRQVFAKDHRAGEERFGRAVDDAFHEPELGERKTITHWRLKDWKGLKPEEPAALPDWAKAISAAVGLIGEYGLWLLAAVVVVVLLLNLRRWLPWIEARVARAPATEIDEHPLAVVTPLPDDLPAAVRKLWANGRRREALALLYRGSVHGLARRLGAPLPPGTTEAQCLRRARGLDDAESEQGLREIVRAWQLAAYAGRWPDDAALEALLARWSRPFGAAP